MTAFMLSSDDAARLKAAVERARTKTIPWDKMKASLPLNQDTDCLMLSDRVDLRAPTHAPPNPVGSMWPVLVPSEECTAEGEPVKHEVEQIVLPFGWRVAISSEEQPAGILLHISMSSPVKGRVPNEWAIEMVLNACGYKIKDVVRGWVEEFEPGWEAVNMLIMLAARQEGRA
jgi:hypothetical protein